MTTLLLAVSILLTADTDHRPVVIVVLGAPGTPEYGKQFSQWADRWQEAAQSGQATFLRLGTDESSSIADRERLKSLLGEQPKQSSEPLWLVFIGHGTFDGQAAKFNLRGPDISAATLGQWLKPFQRPLAVVNCASSSAPFVNRLSGPNRVIVTATKSGYELNYARFGQYFSAAIADPSADLDKDQQTSLLEAFLLASRQVQDFYEQQGRLSTETALIDDNGDGQGTPADWFRGTRVTRRAKKGSTTDGPRAHQFHLVRSPPEQNLPPNIRQRRDELELAVTLIRDAKTDAASEDEYYAKLEPLLVELARLYESAGER